MPAIDLVGFAVGVVICAVGAGSIAGHLLRPAPKDRLLLWLGLFALCYGVRLLVAIDAVGSLFMTERQGAYVVSALNYVIQIPALSFIEELYGSGWRRSMRWLVAIAVAYSVAAVAIDLLAHDPGRAADPALIVFAPGLVLVFLAGWLSGYRPRPFREWRLLLAGSFVFIAFVLHEHAVAAGMLPWRVRIEPIGMLLFIATLAAIAASRFFASERQLIAIENEMEAARGIQASILPRSVPAVAGLDIAARYVPLAAVAGDFYDFAPREDGSVAVLVADVSGHGVPAALIASMVKVAFAGEAARGRDPAAILAGMNATLCGMFDRAYVTAVCAAIDRAGGSLSYAIAGHPPPLLVSADRAVTTLDRRGMFIGMFPGAAYETETLRLFPGDRLIVYTDGVTETANPRTDDLFGLDRLAAFARDRGQPTASAAADALLDAVAAFAEQRTLPHDDVTVVVVDVTARAD